MKKLALITGITGQDGSLLTDFLLKKNYKVIGIKDVLLLLILKELIMFMTIQNLKNLLM